MQLQYGGEEEIGNLDTIITGEAFPFWERARAHEPQLRIRAQRDLASNPPTRRRQRILLMSRPLKHKSNCLAIRAIQANHFICAQICRHDYTDDAALMACAHTNI